MLNGGADEGGEDGERRVHLQVPMTDLDNEMFADLDDSDSDSDSGTRSDDESSSGSFEGSDSDGEFDELLQGMV